jgi:hypothetical protein
MGKFKTIWNSFFALPLRTKILLYCFIFIPLFALLAFLIGDNEKVNWILGVIFPIVWLVLLGLTIKPFYSMIKG